MSNFIYSRRKELGLSLSQIAEYVGVAKTTVQRWETGEIRRIKKGDYQLLCEILKIKETDSEPEQRKEENEMEKVESNQELLWALKIIRGECRKQKDCLECPLCDEIRGCNLMNEHPKDWKLISERAEIWRAFKA